MQLTFKLNIKLPRLQSTQAWTKKIQFVCISNPGVFFFYLQIILLIFHDNSSILIYTEQYVFTLLMLVTLSQGCFWFDINALKVRHTWADEALQSHLAQLLSILNVLSIHLSFLFSLIRQKCNCRHYIKDSGFYLEFSNEHL